MIQCRWLTRSGRSKQEQGGIHLPIQTVQRIEGDGSAAPVKESNAGVSGALATPPYRRHIGRMLGEHQLRVPLLTNLRGVVKTRKPAQIGVQRCHLIFFTYRLQSRLGSESCGARVSKSG